MPADMTALAADLAAESAVTRALVAGLDEAGWDTPTPAAGWDIGDQISHLAYFDEVTVQSATDPEQFLAELAQADAEGGIDPDAIAARFRDLSGAQLLAWFDTARADLIGHVRRPGPPRPAALVRPGHERRVVADRPDHGDLGAHPGHRRRPRRHPRADPPAAPRGAHRRRRPRVQLRRARPGAARGRDPGRARRPGRHPVDLGPAGRDGPGDRPRPGLLPAGHPAQAPRRPRPGHRGPGRDRVDGDRAGLRRRGRHRAVPAGGTLDDQAGAHRELLRVLRRPPGRRPGDAGQGPARSTC